MQVKAVPRHHPRHAGMAAALADNGMTLRELRDRSRVFNLSAIYNLRIRPTERTAEKIRQALNAPHLQFDVHERREGGET